MKTIEVPNSTPSPPHGGPTDPTGRGAWLSWRPAEIMLKIVGKGWCAEFQWTAVSEQKKLEKIWKKKKKETIDLI